MLIAGKYTGKTIDEVWESDPNYLIFIVENVKSAKYPIEQIREFISPKIEAHLAIENVKKDKRKELYRPIIDNIKGVMIKRGLNNKGTEFFKNMLKTLEEGNIISERASSILCDNLAKAKGRRNSNIYKQTLDRFNSIMSEAVEIS
jgi:hypothetical protein